MEKEFSNIFISIIFVFAILFVVILYVLDFQWTINCLSLNLKIIDNDNPISAIYIHFSGKSQNPSCSIRPKVENKTKGIPNYGNKTVIILDWTTLFGNPLKWSWHVRMKKISKYKYIFFIVKEKRRKHCMHLDKHCIFTNDKNKQHEADAILFHNRNMEYNASKIPNQKLRKTNQRYIFMVMEVKEYTL